MSAWSRRVGFAACFVVLVVFGLRGTTHAQRGVDGEHAGVVGLADRLAALEPSEPLAYLRLGEEVAYEVPGERGRRLAQRLYVLSFELDRRAGGRYGLGRSACLALADLAKDERERRWLLALAGVAGMLEREGLVEESREVPAYDEEAAHRFCEMLELFRAGSYRQAREQFGREDVQRVAEAHEDALERTGFPRMIERLGSACPECRGRRVIESGTDDALLPCHTCRGNPGPELSAVEFVRQIALEAEALGIEQERWSAQLQIDYGEPLRDLDPQGLAAWFGIELEKSVWRAEAGGPWPGGRWVEPDDGEDEDGG